MIHRLAGAVLILALGSSVAAARDARGSAAVLPPVVVDVTRLRALGLGETASLVAATIREELGRDAGLRPGERLVVLLTGLSLNAYAGSDSGGGGGGDSGGMGGGSNNDFLEGEVLVLGPAGDVVRRFPQILAKPASAGGAYYLPGADGRRVRGLAATFAQWVRRRLG